MAAAPSLPYGRQWVDDDDIAAVVACLRDPWLTQGPRVAAFEASLCEVTGARFAVAVSSGTAALHLAGLACGVGPEDVAVTSAISFVATANAMAYCGAQVAFCDVDRRTGLLDLVSLSSEAARLTASGRAPKAILPVDLGGATFDREAVRAIANRSNARVIEDCAHSLGARYRVGAKTFTVGGCAHSDAAILSFHPVKHITTGEGGAVLTNDAQIARALRELRSHGITREPGELRRAEGDPMRGPWYYEQRSLGFNYRITDLQCALGASQLRKLAAFVERRRALAARYDEAFRDEMLRAFLEPVMRSGDASDHAFHLYAVQVRARPDEAPASVAVRRRAVHDALAALGIQTQVHYLPIPWHPFWQGPTRTGSGPWPGAEAYYAGSLSLPLFPAMADGDVDRTVAALRSVVEKTCAASP
jgi:UDP-4-amino-4,6-dideoxy-N-acetyl-beta-L-altrosamine transaminase